MRAHAIDPPSLKITSGVVAKANRSSSCYHSSCEKLGVLHFGGLSGEKKRGERIGVVQWSLLLTENLWYRRTCS